MDGLGHNKDLLTEQAPDNVLSRYGILALKGVENTPAGVWHALKEDAQHPLQTVGMVAGAAAFGALVKTVLPQCGTYGKLAGLAIGTYVAYRASEPVLDSFAIAGQAKTMNDLNVAGKLLGDFAGSFALNTALSAGAYKLGGMGAARYFPSTVASAEAAAAASAATAPDGGFWGRAWTNSVEPRLPGALSITTTSSGAIMFEPRLAGIQKFTPSEQVKQDGEFKGPTDGNTELSITVQLKSKASDQDMNKELQDIALGKKPNLTDKEFADKFGSSQQSLDHVNDFAKDYGLKVSEADLRSGRVVLSGTADQFQQAFRTQISDYKQDGMMVRDRSGALFVPKSLAKDIEGVYGLDNRPQATPRNRIEPTPAAATPKADAAPKPERASFRADEVANAYNFPKGTTGKGQSAAIVELGGGIDMANEKSYYKDNSLPQPDINVITINGALSTTGRNPRADSEVSLDSQVLGTVAPAAKQAIIFTSNNEQGFIDAISRGAFPQGTEATNQAMSISWGQPNEAMSEQGKRGMDLALKKAALRGMSVFVAAGDDGASDNVNDGKLHIDFPAADQYVTGVGGTALNLTKDGKISLEVAWNDNKGTTGGGFAPFAAPDYQKELTFQAKNVTGRGVPDVSGNASPNTGYKIRNGGKDIVSGGTSAVAPLYTALALRLNEGLGGGTHTVGFMNPFLYQQALSGKANFFNDVTQGNNNGYEAGKGWDPVTGWGSIDGEKLLAAYKQAGK